MMLIICVIWNMLKSVLKSSKNGNNVFLNSFQYFLYFLIGLRMANRYTEENALYANRENSALNAFGL